MWAQESDTGVGLEKKKKKKKGEATGKDVIVRWHHAVGTEDEDFSPSGQPCGSDIEGQARPEVHQRRLQYCSCCYELSI